MKFSPALVVASLYVAVVNGSVHVVRASGQEDSLWSIEICGVRRQVGFSTFLSHLFSFGLITKENCSDEPSSASMPRKKPEKDRSITVKIPPVKTLSYKREFTIPISIPEKSSS